MLGKVSKPVTVINFRTAIDLYDDAISMARLENNAGKTAAYQFKQREVLSMLRNVLNDEAETDNNGLIVYWSECFFRIASGISTIEELPV